MTDNILLTLPPGLSTYKGRCWYCGIDINGNAKPGVDGCIRNKITCIGYHCDWRCALSGSTCRFSSSLLFAVQSELDGSVVAASQTKKARDRSELSWFGGKVPYIEWKYEAKPKYKSHLKDKDDKRLSALGIRKNAQRYVLT